MKVLWFSATPAGYVDGKAGGWIYSLEKIIQKFHSEITLGIAFEYNDKVFKQEKKGVTYYPISVNNGLSQKLISIFDRNRAWNELCKKVLGVVNDFKPDIIQCFGSEWPYAMIVKYIDTPIVVHMQGFINIYNTSYYMAINHYDYIRYNKMNPKKIANMLLDKKRRQAADVFEKELMKCNHYFMGRTDWDKDIVKFYSPGSEYFYCAEAIRETIYNSKKIWKYNNSIQMRLITITQAGVLKGNEIILKTAWILKNVFGFNFWWRVAGSTDAILFFEKKSHIKHNDVNVELLGMIDAEYITQELSTAHAYIHPAIIDNSPNSLCEAQIIGCPVIAANVGGISSLVENNVSGVLYPYNEPHKLAFEIMSLFVMPEKMDRLSRNERQLALARHNPQTIGNRVVEIYQNILNKENQKME